MSASVGILLVWRRRSREPAVQRANVLSCTATQPPPTELRLGPWRWDGDERVQPSIPDPGSEPASFGGDHRRGYSGVRGTALLRPARARAPPDRDGSRDLALMLDGDRRGSCGPDPESNHEVRAAARRSVRLSRRRAAADRHAPWSRVAELPPGGVDEAVLRRSDGVGHRPTSGMRSRVS